MSGHLGILTMGRGVRQPFYDLLNNQMIHLVKKKNSVNRLDLEKSTKVIIFVLSVPQRK